MPKQLLKSQLENSPKAQGQVQGNLCKDARRAVRHEFSGREAFPSPANPATEGTHVERSRRGFPSSFRP